MHCILITVSAWWDDRCYLQLKLFKKLLFSSLQLTFLSRQFQNGAAENLIFLLVNRNNDVNFYFTNSKLQFCQQMYGQLYLKITNGNRGFGQKKAEIEIVPQFLYI